MAEWSEVLPARLMARVPAYAVDLASTALLFGAVSIMAGRVWRFPFDDEIYTFTLLENFSAHALLTYVPLNQDVHPPLSYLLFHGLRQLGLSDAGLRLCSLAMTALALVLVQRLVLTWIAPGQREDRALPARLLAVALFGLSPLAVSQGDALRWYPLFALLVALFLTLYFARLATTQVLAGAILGLAASTNFLAMLIVPALAFYRYGLERRFRGLLDTIFWLVAAVAAVPAFYTAASLFTDRRSSVYGQFSGIAAAVPIDLLGFFGGHTLGLGQAWIVVPVVLITALAAWAAIDRAAPARPVHLLLLIMLTTTVPMALAGFSKPRSFLYLAPLVAALLTLFFDREVRNGRIRRVLIFALLVLAASVSAIANIEADSHPFKRESVIPYQAIFDFIDGNATGSTLIVSTDPVVDWELRHGSGDRCVGYFFAVRSCLAAGRRYDSIFVISGHNNLSAYAARTGRFDKILNGITAGRTKTASFGAGIDDDAALKSRITGVALDRSILTVDYYR